MGGDVLFDCELNAQVNTAYETSPRIPSVVRVI
jgi:hypothetical protein